MNGFDMLVTRRSVRAYRDDPIDDEVLAHVIEAGVYAPTGLNRQSPIIVAVTNRELRDRLSRMNAQIMGVDSDPFYGAPVVLVVLADRSVPTYVYDGSLVMGNLMNAAHEQGLGSCWIHRAKEEFDSPEGRQSPGRLGHRGRLRGHRPLHPGLPRGARARPQAAQGELRVLRGIKQGAPIAGRAPPWSAWSRCTAKW